MMRKCIAVLVVTLVTLLGGGRGRSRFLRLGDLGFPGSCFAITTDRIAKEPTPHSRAKQRWETAGWGQAGRRRADDARHRNERARRCLFASSRCMDPAEQKFGVFEMPII